MNRHIVLLRGINLGPHKRVAMPELRAVLTEAGFGGVRTYVQSGNIVLSSDRSAAAVAKECKRRIAEHFGFAVDVVARTRDELAEVVRRNPLAEVAVDPKRYQVTFLASELERSAADKLAAVDAAPEQVVLVGRELYSWHPEGVGRSKLWARLASDQWLGVTATARNWTTVSTLLTIADEEG